MKTIAVLALKNGNEPFHDWINSLDQKTQARIHVYIDRVAAGGSKKNIKNIGDGVFEIKIDYGPGLRVYFGNESSSNMLILLGGDKGSQSTDITKAKHYWRQYVSK